jgi:hypothetical protein
LIFFYILQTYIIKMALLVSDLNSLKIGSENEFDKDPWDILLDTDSEEDDEDDEDIDFKELLGEELYEKLYEYFFQKCGHHYMFMDDTYNDSPIWGQICRKYKDHDDMMKEMNKLESESIQKFIHDSPDWVKKHFQDLHEEGIICSPGEWYFGKQGSFESLEEFIKEFWSEIGESWMIYPCKNKLKDIKEEKDSYIWDSTKELVGKLNKMIYWSKVNLIDIVIQIKEKETITKDFLTKCIEVIKEINEQEERNIEKYGHDFKNAQYNSDVNTVNAESVLNYCCEKLVKKK